MPETYSDIAFHQTDQVSDPVIALAARLAEELAASWRKGEPLTAAEVIARNPEVAGRREAALRVIYEEVCQRQEAGEAVKTVEVLGRYPQWQAELAVLLDCHRLFDGPQATPGLFPKVGEMLGGFRLVSELGRGALGRVFLATEPALADRPVVLKATPCDNFEHLSLARLQHSYIVPLYAVYDFPERRLRVLCMPFLGGTTLERLLILLRDEPFHRRSGESIVTALEAVQSRYLWQPAVRESSAFYESMRGRLLRETYVEAICRIGACLADALAFAHERGMVHLDVKPSNILITADAQPMLLDFNLSHEPLPAGTTTLDHFGGTRGYMPPEQQAAFDAVGMGRPLPLAVDGRADVYGLALCLYEALGGTVPLIGNKAPRLNGIAPQVSIGLADILHRCLSSDARRRYASASDLATDLRRHIRNLPLLGVYNRSLAERWKKWRTRRPLALAWMGVAVAVLSAIVALTQVARHGRERLGAAHVALLEGRQQRQQGAFAQAILTLTRGQALAEGLTNSTELEHEFRAELRLATRAQAAESLRVVADRLRFAINPDLLTAAQLQELEAQCGRIWEQRQPMLNSAPGEFPEAFEERLRADLLDVVVMWTELGVRLADILSPPPGSEMRENGLGPEAGLAASTPAHVAACRDALRILREARETLGDSVVLARVMHSYAMEAGEADDDDAAAQRSPATAREYYAVGRFLMQAGLHAEALPQLEQALEREPQGFWPNFYHGVCAYRLHRYADAVQAFRVCIALAPDKAPCWFNRALAYSAQGPAYFERALHDYDRALCLDPAFSAALLNRGILHFRLKQPAQAIADFQTALRAGGNPAMLHYHLGLVYWEQNDKHEAALHVQEALRINPTSAEAKVLLERLRRD